MFSVEERQRVANFLSQVLQAIQNLNITAAQPAHDVPAFWSQPVDRFGTLVVAPGAASTTWTTVASYTTGPGRWTRVESYGQDVDNTYAYNGSLSFRFMMGGQAVTNLEKFTEHRGSAARPRRTFFLSNGDNDTRLIEFQVQRTLLTAVPYTVVLSFGGWTWRPLNTYEGPKASQAQ
jgi:hypothetical protein